MTMKITDKAREEAERLAAHFPGDRAALLGLIERQLNALHLRAQVVIGFAAVAVTTTGFSGRLIAGTNTAAQACIIAGLAVILASCFWLFLRVLSVEWIISRAVSADFLGTLSRIIAYRDRKTRAFRAASIGVFIGLAVYAAAIAIMLLNPVPLSVPVR